MDSYVKQYKSRKQTIINGEVVDIEFIRKYYKKLSDYDKQLLLMYCNRVVNKKWKKKTKKYFSPLFEEIQKKYSLTYTETAQFLNLCIQYSFYPYPFYTNNFKKNEPQKKHNSNQIIKNKKNSSGKQMRDPDKEEIERKMKLYKTKPAQYSVSTTEPPSSKVPMPRMPKLEYDEVPDFLQNVTWQKSDVIVRDVWVFHGFLYCSNQKHDLSFYNVKIYDIRNEYRTCTANVIYCNVCNKFFIDSTQYKKIRKNNILPNMRIHSEDIGYCSFKQESELALYGYNARRDTSKSTRQRILYEVIENKLMNPSSVISHLEGLISLAEYNERKQDVIKRYEEDIMFIHNSFDEEKWWEEHPLKIEANIR